jgi:hypothetical protein
MVALRKWAVEQPIEMGAKKWAIDDAARMTDNTAYGTAWHDGYRQGRLDAQAKTVNPDDGELTAAQELRVWAMDHIEARWRAGFKSISSPSAEATTMVNFVLTGKLSA